MGVICPEPRFTDNEDGTVTDNCTGLIWLKDANLAGTDVMWSQALDFCNTLEDDGLNGLSDGSEAGDWRLPNIRELLSLIDYGTHGPGMPTRHPFTDIQWGFYWSSTSSDEYPNYA
jgi:hypothetical protein